MSEAPKNGTSVLIADDDMLSRRVLHAFLEQAHYPAVVCSDGSSATQALLGADAPPIAILDWMMPDLTGPEVCTRVRAADLPVQPYLIILTSKHDRSELAQALNAGADDFLTKPFNAVELVARLKVAERSVLRQRRLQSEIQRLRQGRQDDPHCTELIRKAVEQAVDNLGIGPVATAAYDGGTDQATWTALVIPELNSWLDLLTDITPARADQNPETIWQLHQAVVDAIRLEYPTVLTPLPGRITTLRPSGPVQNQAFSCRHATIRVTSVRSDCAPAKLPATQLRTWDVLSDPYPPATAQEVPLLRRGATLNSRIIERLLQYNSVGDAVPVPVFRPSAFAQAVC